MASRRDRSKKIGFGSFNCFWSMFTAHCSSQDWRCNFVKRKEQRCFYTQLQWGSCVNANPMQSKNGPVIVNHATAWWWFPHVMRIHLATNMWCRCRKGTMDEATEPLWWTGRGTRTHWHSRSHWLSLAVRRDGRDAEGFQLKQIAALAFAKQEERIELLIFLKRIANVGEKSCQARWQPTSERQLNETEGMRKAFGEQTKRIMRHRLQQNERWTWCTELPGRAFSNVEQTLEKSSKARWKKTGCKSSVGKMAGRNGEEYVYIVMPMGVNWRWSEMMIER